MYVPRSAPAVAARQWGSVALEVLRRDRFSQPAAGSTRRAGRRAESCTRPLPIGNSISCRLPIPERIPQLTPHFAYGGLPRRCAPALTPQPCAKLHLEESTWWRCAPDF